MLAWIGASGNASLLSKDPFVLNKSYYICGSHFQTDDYQNQIRKQLKRNAVPSVFEGEKLPDSRLLEYKEKVNSWNGKLLIN